MVMSCMTLPSNKGKAYTDTDSDGKTEIITDITCKFKGKLIAMEVKVDPGSETNCIPLRSFQAPVPSATDGSYCLLGTSETTSFIQ